MAKCVLMFLFIFRVPVLEFDRLPDFVEGSIFFESPQSHLCIFPGVITDDWATTRGASWWHVASPSAASAGGRC